MFVSSAIQCAGVLIQIPNLDRRELLMQNSLMGLDSVEIVMAVEDAFDIRIENCEAEIVRTPRQLINLVWSKVAQTDSTGCLSHRAFNQLRELLMRRCAIPRKAIVPSAQFAALLSQRQRRDLGGYLATDLGTVPFPLVRPRWLMLGLLLGALVAGITISAPVRAISFPVWSMAVLMATLIAALCLKWLTRGLRTEFPKAISQVSDLAAWVVAHKPDLANEVPLATGWTREQVALRVRQIVVEQLNCEAHYHEDALFVEDLGLS